jgi:toxin-antitoxin system PIN domain toxin
MILPDVNVLLHAVNTGAAQHVTARDALKDAYQKGPVAHCWPALLGFLRLCTRAGILPRPLTVEQGLGVMRTWLEHPSSVLVQPTAQHAAVLSSLLIGAGRGGPLVSDAHLAAMTIEHGATMLSFDADFARFAGLRFTHLR